MDRPNTEERNDGRKISKTEEVAPKFFVYTSETKLSDIPKETLTHLRVDSSVTEIPTDAFSGCVALVHVQLPETLTTIEAFAFNTCISLKCVQFVSKNASHESSLTKDNSEEGLIVFPESAMLQIDEDAFSYCYSLLKVVVCSATTKLGLRAFNSCRNLESVMLPEGLQVIEARCFYDCRSLATVNIPSSVIKIGKKAFYGCGRLASLDLPPGLLTIGQGSFDDCSIESLHIPSTVSSIGAGAFAYCNLLRHIKLPPTLERIESGTFYKCDSLESIEIPPTVSFIGLAAFTDCDSLSHLRIPPSLDRLRHWAWEGCTNLISIEFPEGILIGDTENEEIEYGGIGGDCLVNLAIPPTEKFEFAAGLLYSFWKLGRVAGNEADLLHKLRHRFDDSPLNRLCYYQSYHSSEDGMLQLRRLMQDDPLAATTQVDQFGMTPLHILSLSRTPNVDMLLAVMKGGLVNHIMCGRDSFESTPMDYLCLNRTPTSSEVIRRVLQTRFGQLLDMDRWWKSDLLQVIDGALAVDWSSRSSEIYVIYMKLANYEWQEMISFLLELRLWKIMIDEVSTQAQIANREFCRIHSGASIVIPNVLSFLGKLQVGDHCFSLRGRASPLDP